MLKKEEVKEIAQLARLDLSDKELETLAPQLSEIIGYFDVLKEVDTSKVKPTSQPIRNIKNVFQKGELSEQHIELKNKDISTKAVL